MRKPINDDFSGWSKEDFARWLAANYPKPLNLPEDTSWIVELRIHHSPKKEEVFDFIATGDCEACMDDLAKELAFYAHAGLLAKERWEIFIHPGNAPGNTSNEKPHSHSRGPAPDLR
jgi:hypothetical protein